MIIPRYHCSTQPCLPTGQQPKTAPHPSPRKTPGSSEQPASSVETIPPLNYCAKPLVVRFSSCRAAWAPRPWQTRASLTWPRATSSSPVWGQGVGEEMPAHAPARISPSLQGMCVCARAEPMIITHTHTHTHTHLHTHTPQPEDVQNAPPAAAQQTSFLFESYYCARCQALGATSRPWPACVKMY